MFLMMIEEMCSFKTRYFYRSAYNTLYGSADLIHSCCHFSVAIFLALAQEDDVPILNLASKALIGSAVFQPHWCANRQNS